MLHVAGGGLAGLAAALEGSSLGYEVRLYEATGQFGGRCRSFVDRHLGRRIDNGNHLVLAGNGAAMRHLARTGGDRFVRIAPPAFPCLDLATGERWRTGLHPGRLPRFAPPPGVRGKDLLQDLWRLWRAPPGASLAAVLGDGPARRRLWEPLVVGIMNSAFDRAAPAPFRRVLREVLPRGPQAMRPVLFPKGLSAALVDPALATLGARGTALCPNARVRRLVFGAGRVVAFETRKDEVRLGRGDALVLALPPGEAANLLPGLAVPQGHAAILNAHFVVEGEAVPPPFLGLIGGVAEWLFGGEGVVSVTVSAADRLLDQDDQALADRLWADVAQALGLDPGRVPPCRLIREKTATIDQVPANEPRRPPARTAHANLAIAGDWTRTGLPATIEGAFRSGAMAARVLAS